MSALGVSDYLKIFKSRREYCRALLDLSQQQRAMIAAGDYGQLMGLLSQKQRLLGRLDEVARAEPTFWQQWTTRRDGFETGARQDCERVLEESEQILAALLEEENAGTTLLTERRNATQKQLQAISAGSQAHDAYQDPYAVSQARHLDVDQ